MPKTILNSKKSTIRELGKDWKDIRRVLWNGFKNVLMMKWLMVELSDLLSSVLMLNSEIPLANSKKSRSFAIKI